MKLVFYLRYMKGKISYGEVNSAIDQLNKAAKDKYKIVNKVRPSNDYERLKKLDYKEQEDKSTAGMNSATIYIHVQYRLFTADIHLVYIMRTGVTAYCG